jgi:hypothetical protein
MFLGRQTGENAITFYGRIIERHRNTLRIQALEIACTGVRPIPRAEYYLGSPAFLHPR